MKFVTNQNARLSDTPISDLFITEYMPKLKSNSVKIYIYLTYAMNSKLTIEDSDLKNYLLLTDLEMYDSITELIKYGLLKKDDEAGYVVIDVKEIEIKKIYEPKQKVVTIREDSDKNEKRIGIIQTINELYFQGIMSRYWYADIELWFEKYAFTEDVMLALFNVCTGKINKVYIEKVAETWYRAGVRDFASLEEYMQISDNLFKLESKIKKYLRLGRAMTQAEMKCLKIWYSEYNYDYDIIEYALSKSIGVTNTIQYANAILKNWNQLELKTIEDIKKSEEEKAATAANKAQKVTKTKTTTKRSPKVEQFKDYEQRTYEDLSDFYS